MPLTILQKKKEKEKERKELPTKSSESNSAESAAKTIINDTVNKTDANRPNTQKYNATPTRGNDRNNSQKKYGRRNSYNKHRLDEGAKDIQNRALSGVLNSNGKPRTYTDIHGRTAVDDRFNVLSMDDWGKFISNAMDSTIDYSPLGTAYTLASGETLTKGAYQDNPYEEYRHQGAPAGLGRMTGMALNYGIARTALNPQFERAANAVMNGTKVGQAIRNSSVLGKIGQTVGTNIAQDIGKGLVKETIADATLGFGQNALINYGEGLRGSDFWKQQAKDTALDFAVGGIMEGAGIGKQIRGINREADEIASRGITDTLANSPTKQEYLDSLFEKVKGLDENRFGAKSDIPKLKDVSEAKADELMGEAAKVSEMNNKQFNRYKLGRDTDLNTKYYDVRKGSTEGLDSTKFKKDNASPESSVEVKAEEPPKSRMAEKADEQKWEDFSGAVNAKDKAFGDEFRRDIRTMDKLREFWVDRRMNDFSANDTKGLSRDEATAYISKKFENDNDWLGWFRNEEKFRKPRIETKILNDKDMRNAGLNLEYQHYKDTFPDYDGGFETFVNTPITLYRGSNSLNADLVDDDVFLSFTADPRIAKKFGRNGKTETITIKPIDTLGSYSNTAEEEIFVPRKVYEAQTPKMVDVPTAKTETPAKTEAPVKGKPARTPSDRMAYKTLLAMPDSEEKWLALSKKFERDIAKENAGGAGARGSGASTYIADYEGYKAADSEYLRLREKYGAKGEQINGRENTQPLQEGNLQQGTAKGNSGSESVLQGERPRGSGDLRVEAEERSRTSGNVQSAKGDLVDDATDKILRTDKKIPERTAKKVENIETFSKQLDDNRASNEYGCCVSPIDPNDYDKETRYFTTHEGQVTGGVKGNGNIVALSKSSNAPKGVNSHEALMTAIGMGGDRADAYGIHLAERYQRYGLVPVARVKFDENVVREYFRPNEVESSLATFKKMKDTGNEPDVFFFAKFDDLENTIKTRNNGGYKVLSEEELDKLPVMDYDAANNYRNDLLDDAEKRAAYMKEHGIGSTVVESQTAKPSSGKSTKRLGKGTATITTDGGVASTKNGLPNKVSSTTTMPNGSGTPTANNNTPPQGKPSLTKVGNFDVVGGGKNVETTTPKETQLSWGERFKNTIRKARRDFINSDAGFERMDNTAKQTKIQEKSYMARNAKGQVGYILDKKLVDRQGNEIGKSLSDVLGGKIEYNGKTYDSPYKDKATSKLFDEYAMELHNIDRAKQGKNIYGGRDYEEEVEQIVKNYPALAGEKDRLLKWLNDTDGTTSKEQRKGIEERLLNKYDNFDDVIKDLNKYRADKSQTKVNEILAKHPEFEKFTDEMDKWWNSFTDEYLVKSGIISDDDVKKFRKLYPHYVPTFRDMGELAGKESKNAATLIKKATGSGKRELLTVPEQYARQVDRIVTAARRNELNQEIIETIKRDPDGMRVFGAVQDKHGKVDFTGVDLDDIITTLDDMALGQVKSGKNTITAVFNGEKVTANISDEVAKSLEAMNNLQDTNLIIKIGKGLTNPMKFTITGGNPVFFVSNMMRDLPTLYIQSNHGMLKTTTGLAKAAKEVFTNGEKYRMYKALGGAESGYYMRGKGFETTGAKTGAFKRLKEIASFLGEKGEAIPRMAEFINTLEKTGDAYKALRDAAESTVDFSRRGASDTAKALDAWTLYLNAGVQGLDKFARTVKEHPLRTAGRSTAMLGVPFLALTAINMDNPYYQDLTERVKQNNFLIPNLAGEKDEDGNCKTFIKVPLNREYGTVFGTSLYCALKAVKGEEDSWKGFGETFEENFLPNNPITDNILAPLLINIPQNKDFAGRSIIPNSLKDVSPENQYDYDTSGFAKLLAAGANKIPVENVPILKYIQSPMLVDYILDSYSGYYGQVLQSATATGGTSKDNYVKDVLLKQTAAQPFLNKFVADSKYSSKPVADFYEMKDKYAQEVADAELEGKTWSEAHAADAALKKLSKGLYESTTAEKEILANKSLTKAQKDKMVGELRTARNELAKEANKTVEDAIKEYKEAPTFSELSDSVKSKWNSTLKVPKEKWAKVYNGVIDEYNGRKENEDTPNMTTDEKRLYLIENGITSYRQAKSILGDNTSKSKWDEALEMHREGETYDSLSKALITKAERQKNMTEVEIRFDDYSRARADERYSTTSRKVIDQKLYDAGLYELQYVDKHTDNNGSITQPEAMNAIENLDQMYGLTDEQKAYYWYLFQPEKGWKKKPYGDWNG